MKIKLILTIICISILLIGCTSTGKELTDMEKSYFDIISKVKKTGSITSIQVKEIINNNLQTDKNCLNEYVFDGEDANLNSTVIFRYKVNNQVLKVEYTKNTGLIKKVTYDLYDIHNSEAINSALLFQVNDYENNNFNLEIKSTFSNLNDILRVNKYIIDSQKQNSDLYKAYIDICSKIYNKEAISQQYIKKLLPDIEVSNYTNSHFEYKSNDEILTVDNNSVYYSTKNISIYTTTNGLNILIIQPTTLKNQKELYELIY